MISCIICIAASGVALAQEVQSVESTPAPSEPKVVSNSELRVIGFLPPDFAVDDEGGVVGQGFTVDTRLRPSVVLHLKPMTLELEADLFSGQAFGDPWDLGDLDERHRGSVGVLQLHNFQPRKLKASRLVGPVMVEAGLMTSHWGLGLLANDGAHDPYFGRNDSGDIVTRVIATTRPLQGKPFGVAVAADRVYYDDIGSWVPGDQAIYQGILAAQWAPPDALNLGAYAVYRHQQESDDLRATDIGAVDLTFDWPLTVGAAQLRVAGEAATIFGQTTRAQSANSPEGLGVLQVGATGLVSAHVQEGRYGLVLRGGYASGDGDSYDGRTSDFVFDQNFDVGMVMFDEVQGALGASAYNRLLDPANMGQPPDGADTLVSEGAVRHAAFIQPVIEAAPKEWLGLKLGGLAAWNTAPIADPFYSGRNGGTPTNQLNEKTEGYGLGFELDYAVELTRRTPVKTEVLEQTLLLQGGHYFASDDVGVGRADLYMVTGRLRF